MLCPFYGLGNLGFLFVRSLFNAQFLGVRSEFVPSARDICAVRRVKVSVAHGGGLPPLYPAGAPTPSSADLHTGNFKGGQHDGKTENCDGAAAEEYAPFSLASLGLRVIDHIQTTVF